MEFPVLWSGLCPLYCAYCEMLGDISCISYSSNPRVNKVMMMMMMMMSKNITFEKRWKTWISNCNTEKACFASFDGKMSVTVTVHSGELKRIRQLIAGPIAKKKKSSHGQLYGLWTHSNQPVIQYVIGDPKDDKEVARILWENHALRHLGSWSTEEIEDDGTSNGKPPLSFVNMTVELLDNGKVMNVKLKVFEKEYKLNGVLEMLEGHSAFRLQSPFSDQKDQKTVRERYHDHPEDDDLDVRDLSEKPSCQAETKEEQWYSSEGGMQLFGKIHGALQQQFEITGTSRDTKTHDLCVSLKSKGREFAVEFPE
ncbi:hypothetical protein ACROYT_G018916 [Oculina patagonica]